MPVMSDIANAARLRGELVFAYNQGAEGYGFKDVGPWGDVRRGYCYGMAVRWAQLRLRGEDLDYDIRSRLAPPEDWRVTALHNRVVNSGDHANKLREVGLTLKEEIILPGRPSASQTFNSVSPTPGVWLQAHRGESGHITAIQVEETTIRFFDANHGAFLFQPRGRFVNWYRAFLTETGYAERYAERTRLMRVTLPAGWQASALQGRIPRRP